MLPISENFEINSQEDLLLAIHNETEWLSTEDGDEIECISIEALDGILEKFFKTNKFEQK